MRGFIEREIKSCTCSHPLPANSPTSLPGSSAFHHLRTFLPRLPASISLGSLPGSLTPANSFSSEHSTVMPHNIVSNYPLVLTSATCVNMCDFGLRAVFSRFLASHPALFGVGPMYDQLLVNACVDIVFMEREGSRSLANTKELCDGIFVSHFSMVPHFPVLLQGLPGCPLACMFQHGPTRVTTRLL